MTEDQDSPGSVGTVETRKVVLDLPPEGLLLDGGGRLSHVEVAYETYGDLSEQRDNVLFICHALSGDAHAAGVDPSGTACGWWDEMIGPGKGIDTRHYHVVCANVLGGCKGTTGPSSIDPATGKAYGSTFPQLTVGDLVTVHVRLLKHLGIERVAAIVGGSFGGMQVLEWAIRYPDTVDHCICVASAASLSSQALAFDIVGRNAITSDPDWCSGDYYESGRLPWRGLAQARKIGHITYLSQDMMTEKFGRDRSPGGRGPEGGDAVGSPTGFRSNFEVERYLEHQGEKFVRRFDANSYLHITRAMDEFDLIERFGGLEKAFAQIRAKFLVVALSADWLFPPGQSMEIAHALLRAGKRVSYCRLHAPHGHDAFLVDIVHLTEVIRAFLPWVGARPARIHDSERENAPSAGLFRRTTGARLGRGDGPQAPAVEPVPERPAAARSFAACAGRRQEFDLIAGMVRQGSRVLDLGCGDGSLMTMLAERRGVSCIGVDISIQHVVEVIDQGHDVFHGDIDLGLSMIPDRAYDYAVLRETLQVVKRPLFVLHEMLRVAHEGIVSFPNLGNWTHRVRLALRGRMPKGATSEYEWHESPNIHLFSLRDFVESCRTAGIRILDITCGAEGLLSRLLVRLRWCNAGANRVLVRIVRSGEATGTVGPFTCRSCSD